MVAVIAELEAAVGALLAVDPDSLDGPELHDAAVRWLQVRERLEAAGARLVEAWDRRRLWASNGATCVTRRVMGETSCSFTSAKRTVSRARSFAEMPAVAAAVASGDLSLD